MPIKVTLVQPGILGLPGTTVYMEAAGRNPDGLIAKGSKPAGISATGTKPSGLTASVQLSAKVLMGG